MTSFYPWYISPEIKQIISEAIEQYCKSIENLFLADVYSSANFVDQSQADRQAIWLAKAKSLYGAPERTVEPFHFQPKVRAGLYFLRVQC